MRPSPTVTRLLGALGGIEEIDRQGVGDVGAARPHAEAAALLPRAAAAEQALEEIVQRIGVAEALAGVEAGRLRVVGEVAIGAVCGRSWPLASISPRS